MTGKRTIGFVSQDRTGDLSEYGGAGYYRCGIPAAALRAHGYHVIEGLCVGRREGGPLGVLPPEFYDAPPEVQATKMKRPDVLVMQRYMGIGQADAIRSARAAGQVVINDVDDLFDALPPANQAFKATHPKVHPEANVNLYRETLAASSAITVSTPYLAHRLARYGRPVIVVRNAIDLARWCAHVPETPPRLGWTGALSYRANDVEVACGAIQWGLRSGYSPLFEHVGAQTDRSIAELLKVPTNEHPMCPVSEWPSHYRHIDVGVVPLSSHPFNEAKSFVKGLEYAASGIPFVATATSEYTWLHSQFGAGMLARKHKEWVRQLGRLLDEATAQESREAGFAAAKANDIANRWTEWADVYGAVAA